MTLPAAGLIVAGSNEARRDQVRRELRHAVVEGFVDREKRGSSRNALLLEVRYEGAGVRAETRISDISDTGTYIDTISPLPVGSSLKLRFTLPGGHVIEAEGVVKNSQPQNGMGVQFINLNPDDRRRIRDLLRA